MTGSRSRASPLVSRVLEHARQEPDRTAIISSREVVSYGELASRVVSAACELESLGVTRGDRVVLAASGDASFAYGYLAAHLLGAVAVPLDPGIPAARRDHIIGRVEPKVAYATKASEHEILGEVRSIGSLAEAKPRTIEYPGPDPGALADLLFTTGTSGRPKGVMLNHANLLAAAENINATIGNRADDREVLPLPLSHSFGLGRLRCNLLLGGTVILTPGFKLPGEIFKALEKWDATGLVGVPAGFAVLLRYESELAKHADRLRYIEIGSAPMPLEHKTSLMRALPRTRIWMHYGLTEASRSTFIEFHDSVDHLDSIGKATANVVVRIVDSKGREVPLGESGEIVVRGGMVMEGYWQDPELTSRTLVDGWMHTGDIGHVDDTGYIFLHGREDDMINVGGFKVAPVEVEHALDEHEKIERSACIGIPDPKGIAGQVVKAFVVSASGSNQPPSAEDLRGFLRGRLEEYKIPIVWEWVDSLPQTSSGKLQRNVLRQRESNAGGNG